MATGGRVRKELDECQRDSHVSGVIAVARSPADLSQLQGAVCLASLVARVCSLFLTLFFPHSLSSLSLSFSTRHAPGSTRNAVRRRRVPA